MVKNSQFWFLGTNLPKKCLPFQNNTNENYCPIRYIWVSLGTKFHLDQTILLFWIKFAQKRYSRSKIGSLDITIIFRIFRIIYVPNLFIGPFPPKRVFPVQKRKFEHHDWIQHIRVSVSSKFHLQQTMWCFLEKNTPQKSFSGSKQGK